MSMINNRPRKDYIVLRGPDASMTGNIASWNLGPYYFRNWQHNDRLVVKLVGCSFIADLGASESSSAVVEVVSNLNSNNVASTGSDSLLGLVEASPDEIGAGNYWLSGGEVQGQLGLECERFNQINVWLVFGGNIMDVSGNSSKLIFVLEIEYYQQD